MMSFHPCFPFLFRAREESYDVLAVGDWGQRLTFYQLSGKQVKARMYLILYVLYHNTIVYCTLLTTIKNYIMSTLSSLSVI